MSLSRDSRNDRFKPFEEMFIEYFRQVADGINRDFENVSCRAYSHFPGDDGVFFGVYVDCLIDDVSDDRSDNLALWINACDHEGYLTISAEVGWGHPTGAIEAGIFEEPIIVSEQTLAQLQEQLPGLVQTLHKTLRKYPHGR